jgi:adenylate cyclase
MTVSRQQCRLAAILAADVVGFTRAMAADEAGTLAQLKAQRRELVEPRITDHGGHIVKLMGDGVPVEFPSVVEAVIAAVNVQQATVARNIGVPGDRVVSEFDGRQIGEGKAGPMYWSLRRVYEELIARHIPTREVAR